MKYESFREQRAHLAVFSANHPETAGVVRIYEIQTMRILTAEDSSMGQPRGFKVLLHYGFIFEI